MHEVSGWLVVHVLILTLILILYFHIIRYNPGRGKVNV
jgi:hypothetical protein